MRCVVCSFNKQARDARRTMCGSKITLDVNRERGNREKNKEGALAAQCEAASAECGDVFVSEMVTNPN